MTRVSSDPTGKEPARRPGRRNVNGEGNIRQRRDGRWEGRAWVFTTDGREIRKSVYGGSWDEVHQKLTVLKAKAQAGVRVAASIQNVNEFMAYWLREVVGDRVRPSTLRTYEWLSRCYVLPLLGNHRLGKLQPPAIRTFLNRAKNTCQCCAQGKDAARVSSGQAARCCARKPRQYCESYPSDGTIRHLHRMIRAALQDTVVDRHHHYPYFGERPIRAITVTDVLEWVARLLENKVAQSSVKTYFDVLNAVMNAAVVDKVIPDNPCKAVAKCSAWRTAPAAWTTRAKRSTSSSNFASQGHVRRLLPRPAKVRVSR
jgi:hypothetical protein